VRRLQESLDKAIAFSFKTYDLINGIKNKSINVVDTTIGDRLLEISKKKYELLTGARVIPKTSYKEEEYKGFKEKALVLCKSPYIL